MKPQLTHDLDELFEALERNTKSQERLTASIQSLCNSVNDMVVMMDSPEFFDDDEPVELSEFSFRAPGAGKA